MFRTPVFFLGLCLLPLFWLPFAAFWGFNLGLNTIGLLIISAQTLFYNFSKVKASSVAKWLIVCYFILFFVVLLWSLMNLAYNSVYTKYFFQFTLFIMFFLAALEFEYFLKNFKLFRLALLSTALFFCLSVIFTSKVDSIVLFISVIKVSSVELIPISKDLFGLFLLSNNVDYADLINFHNVIAQHVFGFFVVILAINRSIKGYLLVDVISIFWIFFSILLLSGQVLAEIIIIFLFCILVALRKSNFKSVLILSSLPIFIVFSIYFLLGSDLVNEWLTRLSSGNISTGRWDIWVRHWESLTHFEYVFGSSGVISKDPHNIIVTTMLVFGIPAAILVTITYIAFSVRFLFRSFYSSDIFQSDLLYYAISISIPFQLFFAMMISGGYGFPGFSELYKTLLLFYFLNFSRNSLRGEK